MALVDEALQEGAKLVVCPEMATSGYVFESADEIRPFTEPARGPTFQALARRAKEHGAWLVCGFPERDGELLYNSALVVDPTGELADCYRKVLLYDLDCTWASTGVRRSLSRLGPKRRMSTGICMDLNDNRFIQHLRQERPDVVAFCTNWLDEGTDIIPYWRMRMTGWRGWFVAADRWGEERGTRFYGRSAILRPGGSVAALAPAEGDGVLLADADI